MKTKKIISVILSFVFVASLVACSSKPKVQIDYVTNNKFVEFYAEDLEGVTSCEFEQILHDNSGGRIPVPGPSDYEYRGIITLSEEEAEEYFNKYNWTEDTSFVCPDLGSIDTSKLSGDTWYYCTDFQNDNFHSLGINYLRFNGKDKIIILAMAL